MLFLGRVQTGSRASLDWLCTMRETINVILGFALEYKET
jgi:hypothetical protein